MAHGYTRPILLEEQVSFLPRRERHFAKGPPLRNGCPKCVVLSDMLLEEWCVGSAYVTHRKHLSTLVLGKSPVVKPILT